MAVAVILAAILVIGAVVFFGLGGDIFRSGTEQVSIDPPNVTVTE